MLPEPVRDTTPPDFTRIAELATYEEGGVRIKVLVGDRLLAPPMPNIRLEPRGRGGI